MKPSFSVSVFLGTWIAGIMICPLCAAADDAADASAYYGWLDKYQNPEKHTVTVQESEQPVQKTIPADTQLNQTDSTPGRSDAGEIVFEPAEAGEGLGCYYHRSYYSHLPMFKEGAYHLPGSLDVAEPYQKTSSNAISAPSNP